MSHIVFNSFPRSGNVYQGEMSKYFFDMMQTCVHMPEIFGVEGLYNVTIFRKPEDAISSLIMKQPLYNYMKDKKILIPSAKQECELYKKYMACAKEHKDIIYIGIFDDLINDAVKHFENISKKFNIQLYADYKKNFLNAKLSGKLWQDPYDGHVPRPKNEIRLEIEEKVKDLSFIQELNQEYEEFISNYATIV